MLRGAAGLGCLGLAAVDADHGAGRGGLDRRDGLAVSGDADRDGGGTEQQRQRAGGEDTNPAGATAAPRVGRWRDWPATPGRLPLRLAATGDPGHAGYWARLS